MIGIDTNVVIDIFKGKQEVKKALEQIKETICVTRITYLELMFGIEPNNTKHQTEEAYYDEFFNNIQVCELTQDSCKKASHIFHALKKKGKMIEEMDCAIAGILLTQGITTIITKNKKHYENIPDMKVITY